MTTTEGTKRDGGRSVAQWVSFAVAALILAVVVALVLVEALGADDPATPVARRAGAMREAGGHYYLPVDVTNEGDTTAAEVQVEAELLLHGESSGGDQTIDFLAGHETRHLTFVFDEDPADGEFTVNVTGYTDPH